jgi:hypothetical protein
MSTFSSSGYYEGLISGGVFTPSSVFLNLVYTYSDGNGGDNNFSIGESISGYSETFVGYTSGGEIITTDGGNYYLAVPTGGNASRSSSDQVSYTAGAFATCFLRGTLILTARGEVPVEKLRAGDLVATKFGGLRPIRWIGTQRFHPRFAGPTNTPIRFAPGSLGQGIPSTTLFVSPGHAMLVGEVLAHAGALVNGTTITQPAFQGDSIDYFHLDLGPHDCVLANSAWAESYFEDQNRNSFHNAADFHARFPGHEPVRQATCLPIVTAEHPWIEGICRSLPAPKARVAA